MVTRIVLKRHYNKSLEIPKMGCDPPAKKIVLNHLVLEVKCVCKVIGMQNYCLIFYNCMRKIDREISSNIVYTNLVS